MTVEPMDCAAPERELVPFLAAGLLSPQEKARAEVHTAVCAACRAELAESRALLGGLGTTHLTLEEVVDAAWGGGTPPHLADCPRCREEVDAVKASTADLDRRERPVPAWRRPELAWAAALLLAIPAGLFFAGAGRGTPDAPVVRGPSVSSRAAAPQPLVLAAGAPAVVPRAEVLLDFARPAAGSGGRDEARLVDGRGVTLWEGTLPEGGERAYLLLDARDLAPGRLSLDVRRVDPAGAVLAHAGYDLDVPAAR